METRHKRDSENEDHVTGDITNHLSSLAKDHNDSSLESSHSFIAMAANNKSNKLAFLSMPAPASYVAGLGRGYVDEYLLVGN